MNSPLKQDPASVEVSGFLDDEVPIRLRDYAPEDYAVLVLFWLLALDVFTQFFSRYVLSSSIAWTEEIARYLLIGVCFIGSSMAVRRNTHIMVEFFYRYLSPGFGWYLSVFIDLSRITFFATAAYLSMKLASKTTSMMVSIDISKGVIYYAVSAGCVLMTFRAAQLTLRHWRQGYSSLSYPDLHKPID